MLDFKYDIETGNLFLFDSSRVESIVKNILKKGFKLGDNTIYLRPTYIDMDGNPIQNAGDMYPKTSGTYSLGSSSYRWRDLYLANRVFMSTDRPIAFGDLAFVWGRFDSARISFNAWYNGSAWQIPNASYRSSLIDIGIATGYTWGDAIGFYFTQTPGGTDFDERAVLDYLGNLKIDGDFDASALKIGGTEVLTSGRVLQNIASVAQSLLPSSDNTHNLGSSSYKWKNGYIITNVIGSGLSLPNNIAGELHVGWRKYGTSGNYEVSRIAIQPPFHTGGPFIVFARDEPTNAYLTLKYGTNKIFEIRHNGLLWLFNTAYLKTILPDANNAFDLGSSSYRWRNVHAVNLYGTAHYADVYFQDLVCPLCHKRFKEHDKLVLIVTKVSDKEIRCLPAHLECDS